MKALLAIDGSTELAFGVGLAASLAWPSGAELQVLTVLPSETERIGGPWLAGVAYVPSVVSRDRLRADGAALLEQAAAPLRELGLEVTTRLIEGRAASVIVEHGARHRGGSGGPWRPGPWSDRGSVPRIRVGGGRRPGSLCRPRGARPHCGPHPDRDGRIGRRDVGGPVRRRLTGLFASRGHVRVVHATICQPDVVAGLCAG